MAKKKSVGRPKLPKALKQSFTVSMRISRADRKAFGDAAKAAGVTLSQWIRATLIAEVVAATVLADRKVEESNPGDGKIAP